jgi:hypothetical protein
MPAAPRVVCIRLSTTFRRTSTRYRQTEQEKIPAKTATIQTRVDPVVKNNAQMIMKKLNISMSEVISMYLSQIRYLTRLQLKHLKTLKMERMFMKLTL